MIQLYVNSIINLIKNYGSILIFKDLVKSVSSVKLNGKILLLMNLFSILMVQNSVKKELQKSLKVMKTSPIWDQYNLYKEIQRRSKKKKKRKS